MQSLDSNTLSNAVSQKLSGIRELIAEFRITLLHPTCESFLDGLALLLDAIEESHLQWLSELNSPKYSGQATREENLKTISKISLSILINIHREFLPYLDAAARQTPYLVLPTLTKVVDLFKGSSTVDLALLPQFEYSYGIAGLPQFAANEIKKLEYVDENTKKTRLLAADKLPKWTAFVSYPLIERCSALNLTVVAHELAHLADFIKNLYKDFAPKQLDAKSFAELIEEASKALEEFGVKVEPQIKDKLEAENYKNCIRMVVSWLKEIIADVVALHAVGPAYLFSFMEFLGHGAFENMYDAEHPSPAKRLQLLVDELSFLHYFNVETGIKNKLEAIKGKIATEAAQTKYPKDASVADNTLQPIMEGLLSSLREFCKPASYTAERYASEIPHVVEMLHGGIAPIENTLSGSIAANPTSAVAVLNGGWEVYSVSLPQFSKLFKANVSQPSQITILNHLLFKAIEAGELVREWNKTN